MKPPLITLPEKQISSSQFKPGEKHPPYAQYAEEMEKSGHPLHAPLARYLLDATRRG